MGTIIKTFFLILISITQIRTLNANIFTTGTIAAGTLATGAIVAIIVNKKIKTCSKKLEIIDAIKSNSLKISKNALIQTENNNMSGQLLSQIIENNESKIYVYKEKHFLEKLFVASIATVSMGAIIALIAIYKSTSDLPRKKKPNKIKSSSRKKRKNKFLKLKSKFEKLEEKVKDGTITEKDLNKIPKLVSKLETFLTVKKKRVD